jgi:hypothetical protein
MQWFNGSDGPLSLKEQFRLSRLFKALEVAYLLGQKDKEMASIGRIDEQDHILTWYKWLRLF